MATLPDLEQALRNADAAGDTAAARILAQEIVRMRSEGSPERREAAPDKVPSMREAITQGMLGNQYGMAQVDQKSANRLFDAGAGTVLPTVGSMLGPAVGGAAGTIGETMVQGRRVMSGEQPNVKWGEVAKAGATNAIPFAKARGVAGAVKNMGLQGGGGIAAEEARSLIDDGETSSLGENAMAGGVPAVMAGLSPVAGKVIAKVRGKADAAEIAKMVALQKSNALEDATLKNMQRRGAVIPSSNVNESIKNRILESIAGPTNMENRASAINSKVFNEVGRQEARIPADMAMDEKAFKAARKDIAKPYNEIKALGFGEQLKEWREANKLTQKYAKELASNYSVAVDKAAEAHNKAADESLARLQEALTASGRPDLADAMAEARVDFAKNYDVQESVNVGNGDVDARVIRSMLNARGDDGLTGGLNDIARFGAAFPDSSKVRAGMPTSPSAVTAGTSLLAASTASNPATAVLKGGVPFMRAPLRDYLLSPAYQAKNATRNYTPKINADPRVVEAILRASVNANRSGARK